MTIKLYKTIASIGAWIRETQHDLRHYEKRCYISGAITSLLNTPEEAFACERDFAFIAERVKKMGYIAVVPFGMCPKDWPYWKIMLHVCWKLILCKTVYFMDNWQTSKGCRIEHVISKLFLKTILYESTTWNEVK